MRKMGNFKVGLISASQLSFPGDKHSVFSANAARLGEFQQELGFELCVYEKDVITAEDAYEAADWLKEKKTDFILLQTTSFSAGFLAPIFARLEGMRLGLWGIPEHAESGAVPFNSLCGIHMYSSIIGHYLREYKIATKWFYGNVDDELFIDRFRITIRALKAIKKMKHSSVALVGGLAPGFDDLYDDERKLIHLFDGMQVNRLHEYDEIRKRAMEMDEKAVNERLEAETALGKGFIHKTAREMLKLNARFALAYEQFIQEKGYDALAISCWPKFQDDFRFSVCAVIGELNDKGTVAACEGDLTSAVSMLLLRYLSEDIPTLMDLSAFDQKDETVLLWHCGPTSKRFCEEKGFEYGLNYSGMAHEPDEIEVSGTGVVRDMVMDSGVITMARLTGELDQMFLATGRIIDREKPSFHGSRGWTGDLKIDGKPVSALDFLNTVIARKFQHHFPIIKGDYSDYVREVMAWLSLQPVELVPYQRYMQSM